MELGNLQRLAHSEYANRPEEERPDGLREALDRSLAFEESSRSVVRNLAQYRAVADGPEIALAGSLGRSAVVTHRSFGQLSAIVDAPASYLRALPPTLAAQNLNHGLAKLTDRSSMMYLSPRILGGNDEGFRLISLNSERYDRVPNSTLIRACLYLAESHGWKVPPAWAKSAGPRVRPATAEDCIPGGSLVVPGEMIEPSGVYLRDGENFFSIQISPRPLVDAGDNSTPLFAFVITWNDLTGARTLGGVRGLIDFVCGNHMLWGLKGDSVSIFKAIHRDGMASELAASLPRDFATFATTGDPDAAYRTIKAARVTELGKDRAEVVERIAARRIPDLPKPVLESAYDKAEESGRYGSPRTVWGMVSGLTELSQTRGDFESRFALDLAAGKVMDAFVSGF